jgi:hypothetical protein
MYWSGSRTWLKKQRGELEKEVESHIEAQNNLDALYARVFDGTSGVEFEKDDKLEESVKEAQTVSRLSSLLRKSLLTGLSDIRPSTRTVRLR